MILVIGSRKGGVGKSTIATNLAVALSQKGSTVLVDGDVQESSFRWSTDRNENKIDCIRVTGTTIRDAIKTLKEKYKYVVIDVAGSDNNELRAALTVADKWIVPTQPSQLDLDAITYLQKEMLDNKQLQVANPKLKAYALITKASTNTFNKEVEAAHGFIKHYPQFKALKTVIHDRKVYRDAMSYGFSVIELGTSKAKTEIQNLVEEVLK